MPDAANDDDNVVLLLPGTSGTTPEAPLVVRLREALDASDELILVVEPSGRVLFANRSARDQLGLSPQDAVFRGIEALLSGDRREHVWRALEDSQAWRGDMATTRADGSTIQLEVALLADAIDSGDIRSLTVIANDVGERRALEDALTHRTNHDGLTGLANRPHLLATLNELLADPDVQRRAGTLLLLDIDEFRTVTNSLGHEAGDRVLVAFAYRLLRTFPADATLARVGGDEFAVFCPGDGDLDALVEQIQQLTRAPFFIDGTEVHLSVVTGMAVTTPAEPASSGEAMLREADAAAYRAKERGRGTFEVFAPQLHSDAVDRLDVVSDLRRALRQEELAVEYQPKVDLATGTIVGAEALMRWRTPDGEMRQPGSFMQVAEDTGLIIDMGRWILHRACADAAAMADSLGASIRFSVNLSVRQLDHPSCADDVALALETAGIGPDRIELEVTESALMNDVGASADVLNRLKDLGVRIAVDDFGTGYSSLQYLQKLPVDVLKVDRSFVAGLGTSSGDHAIVGAVVQLAEALELVAVAEGVETPEQLQLLRELGCAEAQGYFMARPMPFEDFRDLLARRPVW